jgi:hypothetical protein
MFLLFGCEFGLCRGLIDYVGQYSWTLNVERRTVIDVIFCGSAVLARQHVRFLATDSHRSHRSR